MNRGNSKKRRIHESKKPKANADSTNTHRDDVGFYLTCDQMLIKENSDSQDSQGLGAFLRYGYADSKRNDIADFWSIGFQYQGLIEGRDDDVLGVGFAKGVFSNKASNSGRLARFPSCASMTPTTL